MTTKNREGLAGMLSEDGVDLASAEAKAMQQQMQGQTLHIPVLDYAALVSEAKHNAKLADAVAKFKAMPKTNFPHPVCQRRAELSALDDLIVAGTRLVAVLIIGAVTLAGIFAVLHFHSAL